ncbi:hypothetical protein MPC4_270060 [Methylocella tundrae]|uniref:Uncharacterized protein n=1 Tax=Methylocella tundrae TaxID=227605 RepID=A0A8B6M6M9_METTU|nr:hypothetical protein MPC4_270060 [Methylocella tundrae]
MAAFRSGQARPPGEISTAQIWQARGALNDVEKQPVIMRGASGLSAICHASRVSRG